MSQEKCKLRYQFFLSTALFRKVVNVVSERVLNCLWLEQEKRLAERNSRFNSIRKVLNAELNESQPRYFREADHATLKRSRPRIEDFIPWGTFSLSGEMKSECIRIYAVQSQCGDQGSTPSELRVFFERKERFAWKLKSKYIRIYVVRKVNVAINPFRAAFFLRARNAYVARRFKKNGPPLNQFVNLRDLHCFLCSPIDLHLQKNCLLSLSSKKKKGKFLMKIMRKR